MGSSNFISAAELDISRKATAVKEEAYFIGIDCIPVHKIQVYITICTKIRLHGRRGKGMAESFSRQISRHAPQKEGGLKILCDLPPV